MVAVKVFLILSVLAAYAAADPVVGFLLGKKIGFLGGLAVGKLKYGSGGYGGYGHGYGHGGYGGGWGYGGGYGGGWGGYGGHGYGW
ncbi:glycine-rich protein 3-like [Photinus pyralis]|uniref:glycine-rich protein 3-like n=1 Tax=Photinus pyralis TaxID=7054 RepID=UPI0012672BC2|nr:glycine-rich protein 3-like [Photinus pyralis]